MNNIEFTLLQKLEGGTSHELWKINIAEGVFALKILNPLILEKPGAINTIIQGEKFAQYCQSHEIPAVCAFEVAGTLLHRLENGNLALCYPFIDGVTKYYPSFGLVEVRKIAGLLAKIHKLRDFISGGLTAGKVYSHRDLDPKNVIWQETEPYLIDWEASGLIDPMEELVALAFEWSGFERGEVDQQLFQSFFSTYAKAGGTIITENLGQGLQGFIRNYQDWLQFNEYRQHSNCSATEKELAQQEIKKTKKKLAFLNSAQVLPLLFSV